MPEEFAFWARQSTAKGSKKKKCVGTCAEEWGSGTQREPLQRSGSVCHQSPPRACTYLPARQMPLTLLCWGKAACFLTYEVWPVCLQLQSYRKYPPDSTEFVFTGLFFYIWNCFYSSFTFVAIKAGGLHKKKKKINEYLNSKANFGVICIAML